jgi:hypothetical protein
MMFIEWRAVWSSVAENLAAILSPDDMDTSRGSRISHGAAIVVNAPTQIRAVSSLIVFPRAPPALFSSPSAGSATREMSAAPARYATETWDRTKSLAAFEIAS